MNICPHCKKSFSNPGGLGAHQPYCKSNPNRVQRAKSPNAHAKKGSVGWSKGLTKETNPELARPTLLGKQVCFGQTDETKKKLSKIAKAKGLGGYVQGSGRGKKGWYKGYFCDSSWELAFVIYCIDHDIQFIRNTGKFPYTFNGKIKNYIPDFIMPDGSYVEVKGYYTKEVDAKITQFPHVLKVISKNEIKEYIEYVVKTYGKNYISLYENGG